MSEQEYKDGDTWVKVFGITPPDRSGRVGILHGYEDVWNISTVASYELADRLRPAPATEAEADGWEVKHWYGSKWYVVKRCDAGPKMYEFLRKDISITNDGEEASVDFDSRASALAALAKWREGEKKKPTLEGEFAICNPTVPQLTIYRLNNVKSLRSSGYEYWSDNELRWVGKVKGDGTFDRLAVADEVPDSIPIEEVPPRLRDDVARIRSERKAKAEAKPQPKDEPSPFDLQEQSAIEAIAERVARRIFANGPL